MLAKLFLYPPIIMFLIITLCIIVVNKDMFKQNKYIETCIYAILFSMCISFSITIGYWTILLIICGIIYVFI